MRISDWSSDVCSADLHPRIDRESGRGVSPALFRRSRRARLLSSEARIGRACRTHGHRALRGASLPLREGAGAYPDRRSEEHTSELQSLMRISYAVFCLKIKNKYKKKTIIRSQFIHKQ